MHMQTVNEKSSIGKSLNLYFSINKRST